MTCDSFYRFSKIPELKSKFTLDRFTGRYEPLHRQNKKGDVTLYVTKPNNINSSNRRKPAFVLSDFSDRMTGLYFSEPEFPELCYGDVAEDVLLCRLSGTVLEIAVYKGKRNNTGVLFSMFCDGELNEEIDKLRSEAVPVSPSSGMFGNIGNGNIIVTDA